jgi:hypothetical protein
MLSNLVAEPRNQHGDAQHYSDQKTDEERPVDSTDSLLETPEITASYFAEGSRYGLDLFDQTVVNA